MKNSGNDITLATRNLSIGYSESNAGPVLANLNLKLTKGKLVSFMGPNGIGKTTLLRTLAGLMKPLQGQVLIHGKEIREIAPVDLAKKISVVLTDPILAGGLTVMDLVAMGRYPYINWFMSYSKKDVERVEQAVTTLELQELKEKKITELSDGQRQKVLIARALAQDGDILILDEPNSHLDLNNRIEIMRILRKMSGQTGKTILVATHELDLALQTSDRLWLATRSGNLIDGVPEDLVLSDAFDEVFDTKGFDLKTGRVIHELQSKVTVAVEGTGYLFLWTKNAFERAGISINDSSDIKVKIAENDQKWQVQSNDLNKEVQSIEELLEILLHK